MKMLNINYRGEVSVRDIIPISLCHKTSEWHGPAWHFEAYEKSRDVIREFDLANCDFLSTSSQALTEVARGFHGEMLRENSPVPSAITEAIAGMDKEERVRLIVSLIRELEPW